MIVQYAVVIISAVGFLAMWFGLPVIYVVRNVKGTWRKIYAGFWTVVVTAVLTGAWLWLCWYASNAS